MPQQVAILIARRDVPTVLPICRKLAIKNIGQDLLYCAARM
jgi:hypothetical protein